MMSKALVVDWLGEKWELWRGCWYGTEIPVGASRYLFLWIWTKCLFSPQQIHPWPQLWCPTLMIARIPTVSSASMEPAGFWCRRTSQRVCKCPLVSWDSGAEGSQANNSKNISLHATPRAWHIGGSKPSWCKSHILGPQSRGTEAEPLGSLETRKLYFNKHLK